MGLFHWMSEITKAIWQRRYALIQQVRTLWPRRYLSYTLMNVLTHALHKNKMRHRSHDYFLSIRKVLFKNILKKKKEYSGIFLNTIWVKVVLPYLTWCDKQRRDLEKQTLQGPVDGSGLFGQKIPMLALGVGMVCGWAHPPGFTVGLPTRRVNVGGVL